MRLPPLPGATREAERIAALYPGSRLLTGSQARRSALVDLLGASSVFHFAGHAIANAEQPELSYLALASTEAVGGDDGTLRGSEIGALRLSNLELAVLSACSTLNPRSSHTGAIAGLAYSFLRAGVPATISTLWDVDDAATAELLVEFHRRFSSGRRRPRRFAWRNSRRCDLIGRSCGRRARGPPSFIQDPNARASFA
jgi:CHAT domain-containing protein